MLRLKIKPSNNVQNTYSSIYGLLKCICIKYYSIHLSKILIKLCKICTLVKALVFILPNAEQLHVEYRITSPLDRICLGMISPI